MSKKQKVLGKVGNYALCLADELNYGIYKIIDEKDGTMLKRWRNIAYHGKLATAFTSLLEKLIKDEIQQSTISDLTDIISIVKSETNKVLVFGQQIDQENLRKRCN